MKKLSEIIDVITFNKPIKVKIRTNKKARIWVKHNSDADGKYWTDWLVTQANVDCSNIPDNVKYNGDEINPDGNGDVEVYSCGASTFVAYEEESKSSGGSSSWGGWSSKKDTTKTETWVVADTEEADSTTDTGTTDTVVTEDLQKVLADGFTVEFHNAYDFAFQNGITTMSTIQEANMEGSLTRIAMAKMLSQYAINIFRKDSR